MKKFTSLLLAAVLSLVVALPAFASDGAEHTEQSGMDRGKHSQHEVKKASKQLDATQLACVSPAVEKREVALDAGVSAFTASVNAAYTARHIALTAAWAMTDGTAREVAVKAAWSTFRDSVKTARKTLRDVRKASWSTFRTEVKACGVNKSAAESESADNI